MGRDPPQRREARLRNGVALIPAAFAGMLGAQATARQRRRDGTVA
nr:hypothetical protein [Escherichia coli O25b:H4-ST131]